MKVCLVEIDTGEFIIRDDNTRRIRIGIELRMNQQALLCGRTLNQIDNDFVCGEWSATPVERNVAKHAMLDLVPLAGTRREMTNRNRPVQLVNQPLQSYLPQPAATTVTATAICRNQEFMGWLVTQASHLLPPAADALDGEFRGIMIKANTHPPLIGVQIIDAIGNCLPQLFVDKIMDTHRFWLLLRLPFATSIVEIAHQFLLFGVHRDHRLAAALKGLHLRIDIGELGVAVGMRTAFLGFTVGLQTVAKLVQQVSHLLPSDAIPLRVQGLRQVADALATPAQGRLWMNGAGGCGQPAKPRRMGGVAKVCSPK